MATLSINKLERELEAAQGQLDYYDGLHEGYNNQARKDLLEAISELREKIEQAGGKLGDGPRAEA